MNIEDIIHKPSPARISIKEMTFVIEQYIKEKKGRDVTINLERGLPPRASLIFGHLYQSQLKKLNNAFSTASEYFISI